jgi:hypothetical protein
VHPASRSRAVVRTPRAAVRDTLAPGNVAGGTQGSPAAAGGTAAAGKRRRAVAVGRQARVRRHMAAEAQPAEGLESRPCQRSQGTTAGCEDHRLDGPGSTCSAARVGSTRRRSARRLRGRRALGGTTCMAARGLSLGTRRTSGSNSNSLLQNAADQTFEYVWCRIVIPGLSNFSDERKSPRAKRLGRYAVVTHGASADEREEQRLATTSADTHQRTHGRRGHTRVHKRYSQSALQATRCDIGWMLRSERRGLIDRRPRRRRCTRQRGKPRARHN